MKIDFYETINDSVKRIHDEVPFADWHKKVTWVDIRADKRTEVTDHFKKMSFLDEGRDVLEHPENYSVTKRIKGKVLVNIVISNAKDIYKADFITFILDKHLIISIIPESADLLDESLFPSHLRKNFSAFLDYIFHSITTGILTISNINIGLARSRIHHTEDILTTRPGELMPSELMTLESDIGRLTDIIEDQYVGFGILASLSSALPKNETIEHIEEMLKGFEVLDKTMSRLEEKAGSLRLQYMLIQQEKSTRKINFLTIVQAVFVPLTFIAGIYGMNFKIMPELNWPYGYLLVWVVFILIAGGLLSYFYKNGWFK